MAEGSSLAGWSGDLGKGGYRHCPFMCPRLGVNPRRRFTSRGTYAPCGRMTGMEPQKVSDRPIPWSAFGEGFRVSSPSRATSSNTILGTSVGYIPTTQFSASVVVSDEFAQ